MVSFGFVEKMLNDKGLQWSVNIRDTVPSWKSDLEIIPTVLYATNFNTNSHNAEELERLPHPTETYTAVDTVGSVDSATNPSRDVIEFFKDITSQHRDLIDEQNISFTPPLPGRSSQSVEDFVNWLRSAEWFDTPVPVPTSKS